MKTKTILCISLVVLFGSCATVTTAGDKNTLSDKASISNTTTIANKPAEVEASLTKTMKQAKVLEFLRKRFGTKSSVATAYVETNSAGKLAKLCNNKKLRAPAMLALTLSAWAGNEPARATLEQYLKSSQQECGMMAILGATFLEQKRCIPLLIARLASESKGSYFRGLTGVVLTRITACDLLADAAKWTKWWQGNAKTYHERKRFDWDLLNYEVANNPLSGNWQFEVGVESKFINALKSADLFLRGEGAKPSDLQTILTMMRTTDEYAVSKVLARLIVQEKNNAHYRYLLAAATMKRGNDAACASAYAQIGDINTDLVWSQVLGAYSKKVAAVKDIDTKERVKILITEIDKIGHGKFDTDVPAKYLVSKMMAVDPYEVEMLAHNSDDEQIVAGALLLMTPGNLMRMGMGALKNKVVKNRVALYGMMQAMDKLEMGMEGGEPGDLAGEFKKVLANLEALDPDNGVFSIINAAKGAGHSKPGSDPAAAKERYLAAIEVALAKPKFTLYEEESIAAIKATLTKLGHQMTAVRTLQAFRETGSCYTSITGTAERLAGFLKAAIIAGNKAEAQRVQALLEKLAEKIALRHKSIDNMQLVVSLRRHAYNGRAEGLRAIGKNKEANAIIKERNKAAADAQALLFARLDQRPMPPVPVLANMLAEAVLKNEIEFLKKYSMNEKK